MEVVSEYLSSSSISALNHIPSSRSLAARAFWLTSVLVSFTVAGVLIHRSYEEWSAAPVATTVSTHPITRLPFPTVTVCPPAGSNTALNPDLQRAAAYTLAGEQRERMKEVVRREFITEPGMKFAKEMMEITDRRNVYLGFGTFPGQYAVTGREHRAYGLQGTLASPGFGKPFNPQFYSQDHLHNYIVKLPHNTTLLVANGSLVIDLLVETEEAETWQESVIFMNKSRFQYFRHRKTWPEAEEDCRVRGGHLASVFSKGENDELMKIQKGFAWLGGRLDEGEGWRWASGEEVRYTNWERGILELRKPGDDCLFYNWGGTWGPMACSERWQYWCQFRQGETSTPGAHSLVYTTANLTFEQFTVKWAFKSDFSSVKQMERSKMTGFSLSWRIEDAEGEPLDLTGFGEDRMETKPIYKSTFLTRVVNMVKAARLNGFTTEELWAKLRDHKLSVLEAGFDYPTHCIDGWMSSMTDTYGNFDPVFTSTLGSLFEALNITTDDTTDTNISNNDLNTGFEMFSFFAHCSPDSLDLAMFHLELWSTHPLHSILQATITSLHDKEVVDEGDMEHIRRLYREMEGQCGLSLGPLVVALSTSAQVQVLEEQGEPYMDGWNTTKLASSHPPHLTAASTSAFIPFCGFSSDLGALGAPHPNLSFPACSAFSPVLLEGELCYSLDIASTGDSGHGEGVANGLLLLIDTNPEKSVGNVETKPAILLDSKSSLNLEASPEAGLVRVDIHTLSPYSGYGPGRFAMSGIKQMTGSGRFLELPDQKKDCQVERREVCRQGEYRDTCVAACACVPLPLATLIQGEPICGPEGLTCHASCRQPSSCLVSCPGFYADVSHQASTTTSANTTISSNTTTIITTATATPHQAGPVVRVRDTAKLAELQAEYQAYKQALVPSLRFDRTAVASRFVSRADYAPLQLVQVYFDTSTFDEVARDTKDTLATQVSVVGGTMGLFTGFSILSAVEILYYLGRLVTNLGAKTPGKAAK